MAPRRAMESDSSGSDVPSDDNSDAEDTLLREALRARAAAAAPQDDRQQHSRRPQQQQPPLAQAVDDDEEEVLCGDASGGGRPRLVQGVNAGKIGPELARLRAAQGEHLVRRRAGVCDES